MDLILYALAAVGAVFVSLFIIAAVVVGVLALLAKPPDRKRLEADCEDHRIA